MLWAQSPQICVEGKKELRGTYEILQGHGGIWALFEKFASLKEKSVLGLQLDSKLQQAVVQFETKCTEGTPPTPKLFDDIFSILSDTQALFGHADGGAATDALLKSVEDLIKRTDATLASIN